VQKLINLFFKLLEFLVVACMVAMVVMVFGNVVLRYGFNSGILVSDELSRYCFVWLTYIGGMVAMHERAHVGVDIVVKRLPLLGKKICFALSELLMLAVNVLFFIGTWKMHELQLTNVSPVLGMSMIWIYGIGYVVSVVIGAINLHALYMLFSGREQERDLVQVRRSEGAAEAEVQLKEMRA
jgi:TRAP-type C4-dicarboxylate transport system permease small subunit